ncbi:MAG: BrnA antitoxin family protein [Bacteriovoracaceae bacterium]|nr:BrnA antitoxin family protein [Bacteriovoracaceae bacterium]
MNKKKIPKFKNEDQEREFWSKEDSMNHFDLKQAKKISFPHLKPSSQSISLRLTEEMLEELKIIANRRDVPYQSLIKIFLKDRLDKESA